MAITRIPFRETGYFSTLICDYLDHHPGLQSFHSGEPNWNSFKNQIEEKGNCFSKDSRETLVSALKEQYQNIAEKELIIQQIDLLSDEKTFTVTTGHQLNLLTGPLYFIYKIVSTINSCKALKAQFPAYNFVPVYWMASEDHDFEEISFFHFQGKKIKWNKDAQGAVGRMPIDDLESLIDHFELFLGNTNNASQLKDWIENSYRKASTLAEATRLIVHSLFSDQGLVIVDADHPGLKKQFIPHLKNEIVDQNCATSVSQSIEALKKEYSPAYKPQVNPREVNLFYLDTNSRERLVKKGNSFQTVDSKNTFTEKALIDLMDQHPEKFSPNVLMRPLYQEVILPNLAYIGGGGELAYWLQLKTYFSTEHIPFPLLMLRNSAVLISEKNAKKAERLQLTPHDLFLKRNELINKKIRAISNVNIDLEALRTTLANQFLFLEEIVSQTDASFEGAVKAQKKKQLNGINALEKRLLQAQKKKLIDHVERLSQLQEKVFPQESLQERHANFFEFYLHYGDALLPFLLENLDPFSKEFFWLTVDDK